MLIAAYPSCVDFDCGTLFTGRGNDVIMILKAVAGTELSTELEGLRVVILSMRGTRISGESLGVKAPRLLAVFEDQHS